MVQLRDRALVAMARGACQEPAGTRSWWAMPYNLGLPPAHIAAQSFGDAGASPIIALGLIPFASAVSAKLLGW